MLAVLLSLLQTGVVAAQSADVEFDRGMTAFNAGRYEAAAEALTLSYRLKPSARALYQLGLAYNGMGQPAKAQEAFEAYTGYADPQADKATIVAAQNEITRIKTTVGRFNVKVNPPTAVIQIDGHAAAIKNREIWMMPGRHTIDIRADGFESYSQTFEVQSGRYSLEINLRKPVGEPPVIAGALVDEGMALKLQGDHQGALAKFEEAQRVFRTPRGLAQLGLVQEVLGDLASAEDNITEALAANKDPWIRKNKPLLKKAQKRIMRYTRDYAKLEINGAYPGALIYVNQRLIGALPLGHSVRVPAGRIVVLARLEGYLDFAFEQDLPRRSTKPVIVQLDPVPPPPPPPPPRKPEPPPPPPAAAPPPPPAAEPAPEPEPEPIATADYDAAQDQMPEEDAATGFEIMVNGGYQLWLGDGPFGSSGAAAMQLDLGARLVWPFSFGIELLGSSLDWSTDNTDFILTLNPAIYLRLHSQKTRKAMTVDVWGGAAIAPFAMTITSFDSASTEQQRVAQSEANAAQRQAIRQQLGLGDVATLQTIAIPVQLGATLYVTKTVGINLSVAFSFFLPQQLCYHDGEDSYCVEEGLDMRKSLFVGAGVSFLP